MNIIRCTAIVLVPIHADGLFVFGISCIGRSCACKLWSVMQVIAQQGTAINAASLAVMPYADATVKETLRFLPVIAVAGRTALKTFEVGGYTIPKASFMLLSEHELLNIACTIHCMYKPVKHSMMVHMRKLEA